MAPKGVPSGALGGSLDYHPEYNRSVISKQLVGLLEHSGVRGAIAELGRAGLRNLASALYYTFPRKSFRVGNNLVPYYGLECLIPRRYRGINPTYRLANVLSKFDSERAVEVPLARKFVEWARFNTFLEVGNVLNYYYDFPPHDVIDKYEVWPGVQNVDVADYDPAQPYDVVVSISTIEHVGFDEPPRDPAVAPRALDRLRSFLSSEGRAMVTAPVGYNPGVDAYLDAAPSTGWVVRYFARGVSRFEWRALESVDVEIRRPQLAVLFYARSEALNRRISDAFGGSKLPTSSLV